MAESKTKSEVFQEFSKYLEDPCLRSTARILILISLGLNGKLGFTDLLRLTGLGKGSLSNHIEKLEDSGYVRVSRRLTFSGWRVLVEITEDGLKVYNSYLKTLELLLSQKEEKDDEYYLFD